MPKVSCPKCERSLKIAESSVGKSVKCPCGNVFKANGADEPAPATPKPATPKTPPADTIVIACDGCQAKLKVPSASRGKKMKCSKCGTTFVVPTEEPTPVVKHKPAPPPEPIDEPGEQAWKPGDTPAFLQDNDDAPPAKKSSKPPFIEEDEIEFEEDTPSPKSKTKPAARTAPAPKPAAVQPAPASGCFGLILTLFVLAVVCIYTAAFVLTYLRYVTPPDIGLARPAALPQIKPAGNGDSDQKKTDNNKAGDNKPGDNKPAEKTDDKDLGQTIKSRARSESLVLMSHIEWQRYAREDETTAIVVHAG